MLTISELITSLNALLAEHGDLNVFVSSDEEGNRIYDAYSAELEERENEGKVVVIWPGWTPLDIF